MEALREDGFLVLFQSSPAPKSGRYWAVHEVVNGLDVSILARPEERALR